MFLKRNKNINTFLGESAGIRTFPPPGHFPPCSNQVGRTIPPLFLAGLGHFPSCNIIRGGHFPSHLFAQRGQFPPPPPLIFGIWRTIPPPPHPLSEWALRPFSAPELTKRERERERERERDWKIRFNIYDKRSHQWNLFIYRHFAH